MPASPVCTTLVQTVVPIVSATTVSSSVQPVTPVGAETVRVTLLMLSTRTRRSPTAAAAGTVTLGALVFPAAEAAPTKPTGLSTGGPATVTVLLVLSVAPSSSVTTRVTR